MPRSRAGARRPRALRSRLARGLRRARRLHADHREGLGRRGLPRLERHRPALRPRRRRRRAHAPGGARAAAAGPDHRRVAQPPGEQGGLGLRQAARAVRRAPGTGVALPGAASGEGAAGHRPGHDQAAARLPDPAARHPGRHRGLVPGGGLRQLRPGDAAARPRRGRHPGAAAVGAPRGQDHRPRADLPARHRGPRLPARQAAGALGRRRPAAARAGALGAQAHRPAALRRLRRRDPRHHPAGAHRPRRRAVGAGARDPAPHGDPAHLGPPARRAPRRPVARLLAGFLARRGPRPRTPAGRGPRRHPRPPRHGRGAGRRDGVAGSRSCREGRSGGRLFRPRLAPPSSLLLPS